MKSLRKGKQTDSIIYGSLDISAIYLCSCKGTAQICGHLNAHNYPISYFPRIYVFNMLHSCEELG